MNQRKTKIISYWILAGPPLILFLSVILFPILFSLIISLSDWSGSGSLQWVGLKNYIEILHDRIFFHGLRNNLLIVAISVLGQIPLGFVLAYILYRKIVKREKFFETMIFLPITISPVVIAILWNQIFSTSGLYTSIIRKISNNPRYVVSIFENQSLAIIPILFVILWMYTGMYMVMYLANLQKISPSILEAAEIDGASESQILLHIIFPFMQGVIMTTTIFAITGSLKSFDLIYAMTGGGPAHFTEVIAIYMYTNTFKYYKYGFGSAVSIIIVLLSVGLILLLQILSRRLDRKYS
ncbi:carbohydrate ABC transporter permease [Sediminispirochaeta smaragdinae]|uniref:Binding-protein-dependent transport systems inner membrane component n=1 Tax=Sediminispirochaeta smaragdinae (strain DSM 11293 / JCM 15392 / SEBR 4228) TaxID=573413 RepID=E1R356_SEDSS|nr:sugar ABC transporter permease [Sediminispirochaeta smaragdinae]ADK81242.1 binding-protein-dependent transport systems inner membrane component [Sediminispirochaeta smaragdinae DSM 11293]